MNKNYLWSRISIIDLEKRVESTQEYIDRRKEEKEIEEKIKKKEFQEAKIEVEKRGICEFCEDSEEEMMWHEDSFICYDCYVYNEKQWSGIDIYRSRMDTITRGEWDDLCEERKKVK